MCVKSSNSDETQKRISLVLQKDVFCYCKNFVMVIKNNVYSLYYLQDGFLFLLVKKTFKGVFLWKKRNTYFKRKKSKIDLGQGNGIAF